MENVSSRGGIIQPCDGISLEFPRSRLFFWEMVSADYIAGRC